MVGMWIDRSVLMERKRISVAETKRNHLKLGQSHLRLKRHRVAYWPDAYVWETVTNDLYEGSMTVSYVLPEKQVRFPEVYPEEVPLSPHLSKA